MMRWKIVESYLCVSASVAKLRQVYESNSQHCVFVLWCCKVLGLLNYLWGLVGEEGNGDVAVVCSHQNTLRWCSASPCG